MKTNFFSLKMLVVIVRNPRHLCFDYILENICLSVSVEIICGRCCLAINEKNFMKLYIKYIAHVNWAKYILLCTTQQVVLFIFIKKYSDRQVVSATTRNCKKFICNLLVIYNIKPCRDRLNKTTVFRKIETTVKSIY